MRLIPKPIDLNAPQGDDEVVYDNLTLSRLHRGRGRFQNVVIAALVFMLAAGAIAVFIGARNDDKITDAAKESQDRDLAGLVGICGVTNVNRIGIQNFLAEVNATNALEKGPEWDALFDKYHPYFTPVECRALVPEKDRVKLCLQYPPSHDPETGKPTPTTADPINEKAC